MIDLKTVFSPEAITEAQLLIQLQGWLMNLSADNIEFVKGELLKSIFVKTEERVIQLANQLVFAVSKRYMIIPLFSELACCLFKESTKFPSLSLFTSTFFELIIPRNIDSRTLYFLYFCVIHGLYSPQDIVNIIQYNLELEPDHITDLLTLVCFFVPEVEQFNKPLFEKFMQAVKEEAHNPYCGSYVWQFYSEIEELKVNNWELLKQRRTTMRSGDEIIDSIFYDSIDDFQRIAAAANFDFNQNIKESIFSPPHMFLKTLIEFAARCGSLKCFKFLLINDTNYHDIVDSAIIGGNNEIVRILEQIGCNFSGSLHHAAMHHRNAIFHWLESTHFPICSGNQNYDIDAMFGSVESCNIELIVYCLERGIDVNLQNAEGETALSASIMYPSDGFHFLIKHKNIDLNTTTTDNFSPLSFSVIRRVYDAVQFYLTQDSFDISKQLRCGSLILSAAYLCDVKIMKLLLSNPMIDINAKNKSGVYFNFMNPL